MYLSIFAYHHLTLLTCRANIYSESGRESRDSDDMRKLRTHEVVNCYIRVCSWLVCATAAPERFVHGDLSSVCVSSPRIIHVCVYNIYIYIYNCFTSIMFCA